MQHQQDCDGGGVGLVPGGNRLGIGLSHNCSLGGWRRSRGSRGGKDIPSAARGNVLWGEKMDASRRATGGVCGAMGPRSKGKSLLRTAQRTGVRLPTVPGLLNTNTHRGTATEL